MKTILAMALCSLCISSWTEESPEHDADSSPSSVLNVDVIKTKDGKTLTGHYDTTSGKVTLVNERTGKDMGFVVVAADQVVSVTHKQIDQAKAVKQQPAGLNGTWLTNYAKARQSAIDAGRPLLLDFTGSDWCGWCIKLDEQVFSKKEFKDWAKDNVVLVKLDYPHHTELEPSLAAQNQKLLQQYGISGYPTVLVVDPTKEKVLRQWGYDEGGPVAWIKGMITNVPGLEKLQQPK